MKLSEGVKEKILPATMLIALFVAAGIDTIQDGMQERARKATQENSGPPVVITPFEKDFGEMALRSLEALRQVSPDQYEGEAEELEAEIRSIMENAEVDNTVLID